LIDNSAPLGPEWLEHSLGGDYAGTKECHIGGDFLLIYELSNSKVVFYRMGTHSELFE
jgi:mRNA interferase YafQ